MFTVVSFRPRTSNEDGESRSLPSSSSSSSTPPPAFEDVLRSAPSDRSRDQPMNQSSLGGSKPVNPSVATVPRRERHSEGTSSKVWNSHVEAIR